MDDICDLRHANGEVGVACDGEACTFWRLVEHVVGERGSGCAIKHFELLGDDNVAAWLLTVKQRVEHLDDSSRPGA